VFIAAVVGGIFFVSRSSPPETPSPAVLYVERGAAEVAHAGTLDFQPARNGTVLDAGQMVHVGPDSSALVKFPDGSSTRLAPETTLSVHAAWINTSGVISSAILGQARGRILYSIAGTRDTEFEVLTNAVSYKVRRGVFEVDVYPGGLETIRVFQGEVMPFAGETTRFAEDATIGAGQQQVYDDKAGPLGSVEALAADPADPFVQIQRAEAAAAAIVPTPGTEQTFSSFEPLEFGQTVTAGVYSTGGGDVTALLTSPGSDMRLKITTPEGKVYQGDGPTPLVVKIPAGPPGSYRAEVMATRASAGGEPYAVTFVASNACDSAQQNGYVRKFHAATEVAQSVKIAQVSDVSVSPVTRLGGEVLVGSVATLRGGRVAATALIYATPPTVQILLLSLNVQGFPVPTRAIGLVSATQVTALDAGFRVDRIYACPGGVVIEGSSS
jgi:hypothetical protein